MSGQKILKIVFTASLFALLLTKFLLQFPKTNEYKEPVFMIKTKVAFFQPFRAF